MTAFQEEGKRTFMDSLLQIEKSALLGRWIGCLIGYLAEWLNL